jgi:AcrR family transcriptional regulator
VTHFLNCGTLESVSRKKPSRTSGQHHGDLKRSLLAVATQMVEAGNTDFSLRELSRKAGVTAAAPYHHFESKTAVLDEIAADGFRGLEQALTQALDKVRTSEEKLTALVLEYLRFAGEHASHYRLMFPARLGTADEHRSLRAVAEVAFERLVTHVRNVRPEASEDDLMLWSLCVWALCHGFVTLQHDGLLEGAVPSIDALRPRIAALSLRLLGGAPESGQR